MRNATARRIRKLIGYNPTAQHPILKRVYRRLKKDYLSGKLDLNNPAAAYESQPNS